MLRDDLGRFVPGTSGNPGGRPGVPEVIKAKLRELSPRAVTRLGQLLDSADERVQLEAALAVTVSGMEVAAARDRCRHRARIKPPAPVTRLAKTPRLRRHCQQPCVRLTVHPAGSVCMMGEVLSMPVSASVGGASGFLVTRSLCWLAPGGFAPTVSACSRMISPRRCSPRVRRHQGRHCRIFSYFWATRASAGPGGGVGL